MTAVIEPAVVRFEGYTPGTEIWGSTQANFLVQLPGRHAKEAAILLNDPTATMLAAAVGKEDTPEFREEAARIVGQMVFEHEATQVGSIDSLIMISNAFFEQNPAVFERAKAALS
jgi:hypothetical protein